MPDRIYTFQQRLEIIHIERLTDLITSPRRDYRTMNVSFRALCLIVEADPNQPEADKSTNYFDGLEFFDDRIHLDFILVWLARIHQNIERAAKKNLPRG